MTWTSKHSHKTEQGKFATFDHQSPCQVNIRLPNQLHGFICCYRKDNSMNHNYFLSIFLVLVNWKSKNKTLQIIIRVHSKHFICTFMFMQASKFVFLTLTLALTICVSSNSNYKFLLQLRSLRQNVTDRQPSLARKDHVLLEHELKYTNQ